MPAGRSAMPASPTKRKQFLGLARVGGSAAITDGSVKRCASTLRLSCRCRPTMTFSTAVMRKKICRFWKVRDRPRARQQMRRQAGHIIAAERDAAARGA